MKKRSAGLALILAALIIGALVWRSAPSTDAQPVEATMRKYHVETSEKPVAPSPPQEERHAIAEAPAPAAEPPPPQESEVAVPLGTLMFVRIVDKATGFGIAGARIERSKAESPDLVSDASGRCTLRFIHSNFRSISASEDGPMPHGFSRVHAEAYGVAEFVESEGHEREDIALDVQLDKAATLVVSLSGRKDQSAGAYELRCKVPAGEVIQNSTQTSDFDFAALRFKAACDAAGVVRLEGLPANVPLTLGIFQGTQSARAVPKPVRLTPGEERAMTIDLGGACHVLGRVHDLAGTAVSKLEVWIAPQGQYPRFQFAEYDTRDRIAKAISDDEGRFDLGEFPAGKYDVGPAPTPISFGSDADPQALAALNVVVEIAANDTRKDVELRATRGLWIRGIVLKPDGSPMAGKMVQIFCSSKTGHRQMAFGKTESFIVGPLLEGSYSLYAGGQGEFTDSLPVEALAGASDVVLTLHQGAELSLRVVESAGGSGVRSSLIYAYLGEGGSTTYSQTDDAGVYHRAGVAAGRISIVATSADGRIGVIPSLTVAAGAGAEVVEILLAPGARLHVRPANDVKLAWVEIFQDGVLVARPDAESDGTANATVPPGNLMVRARLADKTKLEKSVNVAVGAAGDVVLP